VQICWAKTIFLSQTSMFWLFFIQVYLCSVTYWAPLEMLLCLTDCPSYWTGTLILSNSVLAVLVWSGNLT
jgi:hypothetical protein